MADQPCPPWCPATDRPFWDELLDALEYAWGPLLVAACFAAALALVDATHEIIIVLADDAARYDEGMIRAIVTVALCFFAPVTLYMATQSALRARRSCGSFRDEADRLLLAVIPRLPLAGGLAGMITILAMPGNELSPGGRRLIIAVSVYLALGVLGGVFLLVPPIPRARVLRALAGKGPLWDRATAGPLLILWRGLLRLAGLFLRLYTAIRDRVLRWERTAFLGAALLLAYAALRPADMVVIGPLGLTAAFAMLAAFALAGLTRLSGRLTLGQMPLAVVLVGCVLGGSGIAGLTTFAAGVAIYAAAVLVWPGRATTLQRQFTVALIGLVAILAVLHLWNRRCVTLSGCNLMTGVGAANAPLDVAVAFDAWQNRRAAGGGNLRVRLVAAQGGGLFAAYHTAMYLAKRADKEKAGFADSVFAISGVSGGAVGAAAYWAVRSAGICDAARPAPSDCHEAAVRAILTRDYLTPALAGLLSRDLADTLLPYSALAPTARRDRGELLEEVLTAEADKATGPDPDGGGRLLDLAISDSFRPNRPGQPALFLNATDVHSGERVIAAPLLLTLPGTGTEPRLDLGAGHDLSVAMAAINSARFPVVTPPARVLDHERTRQIVDGGYYDNSGLETVHDILSRIEGLTDATIEVIVLQVDEQTSALPRPAGDQCAPPGPRAGTTAASVPKGMFGAPLSAFAHAWTSRRELSLTRLRDRWPQRVRIIEQPLVATEFNFTVSWFLGKETFCGIERAVDCVVRSSRGAPLPALPAPAVDRTGAAAAGSGVATASTLRMKRSAWCADRDGSADPRAAPGPAALQ